MAPAGVELVVVVVMGLASELSVGWPQCFGPAVGVVWVHGWGVA